MGAWGTGPFENDDATDWLGEFVEEPSLQAVEEALTTVAGIADSEYVEITEGFPAIVAAEIVATLRGNPMTGLPEDLAAWTSTITDLPDDALVTLAIKALDRLCIEGQSEALDTWTSEQDKEDWLSTLGGIKQRLTA